MPLSVYGGLDIPALAALPVERKKALHKWLAKKYGPINTKVWSAHTRRFHAKQSARVMDGKLDGRSSAAELKNFFNDYEAPRNALIALRSMLDEERGRNIAAKAKDAHLASGNVVRGDIETVLAAHPDWSQSRIGKKVGKSQSVVSRHLEVIRNK